MKRNFSALVTLVAAIATVILLAQALPAARAGGIIDVFRQFGGQQVQRTLMSLLAKQLGEGAPIESSDDKTFPTVPCLPGAPFAPIDETCGVASQLASSADGSVQLAPGDYSVTARLFCMKHSAGSPSGHLYLLAPLLGKRAAMIAELNAHASAGAYPAWEVQRLSWDLQSGMSYQQLPAQDQQIVDQLTPDRQGDVSGNILDRIQEIYDQYGPKIGLPDFQQALSSDKLGSTGKEILAIQQFQAELQSTADTEEFVDGLVSRPPSSAAGGASSTPWSQVNNQVFARLYTSGGYQSLGQLEIRVLPTEQVSEAREQSGPRTASYSQPGALPSASASTVNVPITSLVGAPQNPDIQPLTMVPEPQPGVPGPIIPVNQIVTHIDDTLYAKAPATGGAQPPPQGVAAPPVGADPSAVSLYDAAIEAAMANRTACNKSLVAAMSQLGMPTDQLAGVNGQALLANTQISHIESTPSEYQAVSARDAQQLADQGDVVIAVQADNGSHGHVAVVVPGWNLDAPTDTSGYPAVAGGSISTAPNSPYSQGDKTANWVFPMHRATSSPPSYYVVRNTPGI